MTRAQKIILGIGGLLIGFLFLSAGLKLLDHAFHLPETWENGYPLTLIVGTVWAYIIPSALMIAIAFFYFRDRSK